MTFGSSKATLVTMDHLPAIADPAYPLPRVICVCNPDDYDGLGMVDFPKRMGWNMDRRNGPVRVGEAKSRIESPVALLQAWLFFGFLQDVFSIGETEIDLHAFKQQIDGQFYLSTATLKDSMTRLERAAWQIKPEVCLQRQTKVHQCFKTILNFLDWHWDTRMAENNWRVSSILPLDAIMVFVILGETFKNAINQIWPVPAEKSPIRWYAFLRNQNPLKERFLQAGWCPNEAAMMYNEIDNTGLLLASRLRRPFSDKLSHKSCNEDRCLALQTSDEDYETKHVHDCLGCREIVIDQDKISSILRCGGIPVVNVFVAEEGELSEVKILDYNADNSLNYVAISHVWAHGLGNPRRNALPLCQLTRLQTLVGKLHFSVTRKVGQPAFWIDTLCIPVDPHLKEFRKLAIIRLDDTFRYARHVLVLDADLQNCSKRCSRMELATRIVCSGWMRRLWTLSEAVVAEESANASKVDVQFLEGSIELNAVAGRDIRSIYHTEDALRTIFSAFPQFRTRDRAYAFLTRALNYRSTSKVEDEAICVASILGFTSKDIATIAGAKAAEERTHLMYISMDQIPASILFNRSKKLSVGFRWAPATLLGGTGKTILRGEAGRCDAQGLHVQFGGYVVTEFRPVPPTSSRATIGMRYIGDPRQAAPALRIAPAEMGQTSRSAMESDLELAKFWNEERKPGMILNPYDASESALVSVSREEDDIIYASFEKRIYIRKIRIGGYVHEDWRDYLIDVREVSRLQKWCVQ